MSQPVRVLFVDDEARILRTLAMQFRRRYQVLTESDPQRVMALLQQQAVDIVVSDQRMPGMSGSQLLEQVQRQYPNTIRILLTGYSDLDAAVDALNSGGIFRYLTKPWVPEEMVETLAQAHPQLLSIIITPFQDTQVLLKLINQAQIFRYLPKPIRRGMYQRAISTALVQIEEWREQPAPVIARLAEAPVAVITLHFACVQLRFSGCSVQVQGRSGMLFPTFKEGAAHEKFSQDVGAGYRNCHGICQRACSGAGQLRRPELG